MDFYIDIMIPENDLLKCEISEVVSEWGGEIIHKSPREFKFYDVKMLECKNSEYLANVGNVITLNISELHSVEADCNLEKRDITENDIYQLISRIVELRGFKIVIGIYDEKIDHILDYNEGIDLKKTFLKAFNRDNPSGVIIMDCPAME